MLENVIHNVNAKASLGPIGFFKTSLRFEPNVFARSIVFDYLDHYRPPTVTIPPPILFPHAKTMPKGC